MIAYCHPARAATKPGLYIQVIVQDVSSDVYFGLLKGIKYVYVYNIESLHMNEYWDKHLVVFEAPPIGWGWISNHVLKISDDWRKGS